MNSGVKLNMNEESDKVREMLRNAEESLDIDPALKV